MPDVNFTVQDYGAFSNAITTSQTYTSQIDTVQTDTESSKTVLSDSGTLMGPFQDECLSVLGTIGTDFSELKNAVQAIVSHASKSNDDYQKADEQAKDTVSSGDTTTTTGTGPIKSWISTPTDPKVLEAKKKFLGDVDDASLYTDYTGKTPMFDRRNELTLFDNKTGQVLKDQDSITMKPGETRVITVKLPTDMGMIKNITRTTSDGDSGYRSGKVVTARCDIDPDPNNIEYVRLTEKGYHQPSNMDWTHNNHYDWVITASNTGKVTATQTCQWTSTNTPGTRNLKAMVDLHVNVVNEDEEDKNKTNS